jgi:hypothetical protein
MKVIGSLILAVALVCPVAPPASAEPRQISQGTEIHLTLLTPINTSTVQEGDAITAVASEPVVLGGLTILPVGTRLHGSVGIVQRPSCSHCSRGRPT